MKRRIALIAVGVVALVAAGTAGAMIRDVLTPRGKAATFAGDRTYWYCFNGAAIRCGSGDAEPYVTLSKSGIVVRVFNLKRACVKRLLRPSPDPTDPAMKPYYEYIYTFRPFGC
jgi:hypothetical protein